MKLTIFYILNQGLEKTFGINLNQDLEFKELLNFTVQPKEMQQLVSII